VSKLPPYSGVTPGPSAGAGIPVVVTTVFLVTPAGTPYTVLVTDVFVGMDATAGNGVVLLPVAASGREITVKATALAAVVNTVAATPNGAETIDGVAAAFLLTGTQSVTLVGRTGVGWFTV
jgi:hypothetical protein